MRSPHATLSFLLPRATLAAAAAVALLAGGSNPVLAAPVLILGEVDATGDSLVAANNLAAILSARGLMPEIRTVIATDDIGDLAAYSCVWDARYVSALSATDTARLATYAQGGGGIYLTGENPGFALRNNSVIALITALGGGVPTVSTTLPVNTVPTDILEPMNTAHVIQQQCAPVSTIDYDGVANGQFLSFGTGTWLSGSASSAGAAVWDAGQLAAAPQARLVAVLDINWLLDDSRPNGTLDSRVTNRMIATVNRTIVDNIARDVCAFCCSASLAAPHVPRAPSSPQSAAAPCSAASPHS